MTTYEYDDLGRVTRSMEQSPWLPEDRALLLALQAYEDSLCPGCGQPKETAWHPDQDGWWEVAHTFVCHPCTARDKYHSPDAPPVEFTVLEDTRNYDTKPLPPLSSMMPGGDQQ